MREDSYFNCLISEWKLLLLLKRTILPRYPKCLFGLVDKKQWHFNAHKFAISTHSVFLTSYICCLDS